MFARCICGHFVHSQYERAGVFLNVHVIVCICAACLLGLTLSGTLFHTTKWGTCSTSNSLPCASLFTFNNIIVRKGEPERVSTEREKDRAPWLPDLTLLCKQNKCSESSSSEQQGTLPNEQCHVKLGRATMCMRILNDLHFCSTYDF